MAKTSTPRPRMADLDEVDMAVDEPDRDVRAVAAVEQQIPARAIDQQNPADRRGVLPAPRVVLDSDQGRSAASGAKGDRLVSNKTLVGAEPSARGAAPRATPGATADGGSQVGVGADISSDAGQRETLFQEFLHLQERLSRRLGFGSR